MAFFKKSHKFQMTVSSFNGTDCTKKVTNAISSAEYMRNFRITENGKLQKRYGYKRLADIQGEDIYVSDGVIFYRNGKTLNAYNIDKQTIVSSYELGVMGKTVYFTFGGAVYCVFVYYASSGRFRWFTALGMVLGFIVYRILPGRIIKPFLYFFADKILLILYFV